MLPNFDSSKFFLGILCNSNHDYEGTGSTLRYLSKGHVCRECRRRNDKKDKEARRKKLAQQVHAEEIRLAIQAIGLDPKKWILGSLCKYGHEFIGTGQSLRLLSNSTCKDCIETINDRSYAKNIEKHRARDRDRYAENEAYREDCKRRAKQFEIDNAEHVKQRRKKYSETRSQELIEREKDNKRRYYERNKDIVKLRAREREKKLIPLSKSDILKLDDILELFDRCCAYCTRKLNPNAPNNASDQLTWDHVVPLHSDGGHSLSNLIPCCRRCNASKSTAEMRLWFGQQNFFSQARLNLILKVTQKYGSSNG